MTKKKAFTAEPESFSRGRVARKRGIDRDSVTPGSEKKSWQEGWDYQDGIDSAED